MFNYENDYILRMIHLLRLLFEHLLGQTDAQRREEGEQAVREAMAQLTGITPEAALSLPIEQVAELLGEGGEGAARRYAMAEILRARGDWLGRFSLERDAGESSLRALQMMLRAGAVSKELLKEAYPPYRDLFMRFFPRLAPGDYACAGYFFETLEDYACAEDAYCALDTPKDAEAFYLRLLATRPEKVEAGGLTPEEVRQGLARIRGMAK